MVGDLVRGMRYAMLSGRLAARALAENEDYDRLWRDAFGHQLAVGARNRRLYSLFGNPGYEAMIRILASRNPVVARLRRGRDAHGFLTHVYVRRMPRIFQVGALLARTVARRRQKGHLRSTGTVMQGSRRG